MTILYYLYEIKNNINGKIYIGVHQSTNIDDGYMGSGLAIKAAIDKYGIENFVKTILEYFLTDTEMYTREKEFVNEDFLKRKDVYNLTLGGHGGFNHINGNKTAEYYKERSRAASKRNSLYTSSIQDYNKIATFKDKSANSKKAAQTQIATKGYFDNGHTGTVRSKSANAKASVTMRHTGKDNSQFGSCWITHVEFGNKKIKLIELDSYVSLGYNKGRKMK
jgi:hypothetical protein